MPKSVSWRFAKGCIRRSDLDWYSRKLLVWRVSSSMDADFSVGAISTAIERLTCSSPIRRRFCQSDVFTGVFKAASVGISMDCRGRWVDNVQVERLWRSRKYHEIYLKAYLTVAEARFGIGSYFRLYNCAPWQRLLDGQTSGQIYGGRVMWPVAA